MPVSKIKIDTVFVKTAETPAVPEKAKTILLTIDRKEASVFGEVVVNDAAPIIRNDRTMLPAFIENDRTYLPVRFIAETLGATVTWDQKTQEVTITPKQ